MQGQVFPGDADRNGQVNHEDILYIGYAYGTVGPARVEPGIETMEAPLALQWAEAFPNGENFAFADANGDGTVGINDMLAVFTNYGFTNKPVPTLIWCSSSTCLLTAMRRTAGLGILATARAVQLRSQFMNTQKQDCMRLPLLQPLILAAAPLP